MAGEDVDKDGERRGIRTWTMSGHEGEAALSATEAAAAAAAAAVAADQCRIANLVAQRVRGAD